MSVPWYLMAKGKGGGGYKTASGPIVSINDALAAPLRSLRVGIDPVQAGTGDPSPDNVRPISGWTEANVWRTGKNLIDLSFLEFDDSVYVHDYYPATTPQVTEYAQLMAKYVGKTIVLSASITGTQSAGAQPVGSIRLANSGGGVFRLNPNTPTTVPDMDYSNVSYLIIYGSINGASVSDIQLELGSTPTAYTPYTGNQFTIQLGQTVYGGYIQVGADGSAELLVDRAEVDLGTLDWSPWGAVEGLYGANISDMKAPTTADERKTEIICSMYPVASTATMNNNFTDKSCARYQQNVFIRDTGYATADALAAALDGVQFVYPLATPLTYTLTPQQLDTLKGQNVVWGDCGDVTVEYLSAGGANADLMKLAVAFMGEK